MLETFLTSPSETGERKGMKNSFLIPILDLDTSYKQSGQHLCY